MSQRGRGRSCGLATSDGWTVGDGSQREGEWSRKPRRAARPFTSDLILRKKKKEPRGLHPPLAKPTPTVQPSDDMTSHPLDIEQHDQLLTYLRATGRIVADETPELRTLAGG